MAAEVGVDVRAPRTEEGANAIACEGGEDSEAGGSGATEEPEEEGLGAILGMMAGRDAVCPGGTGGGTKGVPARDPGPRLKVAPSSHLQVRPPEWDLEGLGELLCAVQLFSGFGAEAVIHPVGEQAKRELAADAREHVKEGHRIRPAAHGGEDARSAGCERLPPESGKGQGDEGRRVRPRHGSRELERLAELEGRLSRESVASRRSGVCQRAPGRRREGGAVGRLEVYAVVASKAELEPARLLAQPAVDDRLHRDLPLRRFSTTTASTWLV
jgi:hypothetical protein